MRRKNSPSFVIAVSVRASLMTLEQRTALASDVGEHDGIVEPHRVRFAPSQKAGAIPEDRGVDEPRPAGMPALALNAQAEPGGLQPVAHRPVVALDDDRTLRLGALRSIP